MSMTWGPAFDAEVDYRMRRTRSDFSRSLFHRKQHAQRNSSPRQPIRRPAI